MRNDIFTETKNNETTIQDNFVKEAKNNFSGLVDSELIFASSPEKINEFFWSKDVVVCKDRPKIRAILYQDFFIKSYNHTGWLNFIRRVFKTSRPMKVLKAFQQLEKHNIPTPKVLAALTEKKAVFPVVDYLVTQSIPSDVKFANYLLNNYANQTDFDLSIAYKWILSAIPLVVKMHEANVLHGDLNLRNLYYNGTIDKLNGSWGVIDLDGTNVYTKKLSANLRVKDLACFVVGFLKVLKASDIDIQFADVMLSEYEKLTCITIDRKLYHKRIIYLYKRHKRFLKKYYKMKNK